MSNCAREFSFNQFLLNLTRAGQYGVADNKIAAQEYLLWKNSVFERGDQGLLEGDLSKVE